MFKSVLQKSDESSSFSSLNMRGSLASRNSLSASINPLSNAIDVHPVQHGSHEKVREFMPFGAWSVHARFWTDRSKSMHKIDGPNVGHMFILGAYCTARQRMLELPANVIYS